MAGNQMKMREALLSVIGSMDIEARYMCTEKDRLGKFDQTQTDLCKCCRARNEECWPMTLKRKCEAALSAPPRNCDVGTPEEQTERLFRQHGDMTLGAKVALAWAQMSYEAQEGGAE